MNPRVAIGLAILALCSCSEMPNSLLGVWRGDVAEISELTFERRTYSTSYDFGTFSGTTSGTYAVVGDSIEFREANHTAWDASGKEFDVDPATEPFRKRFELRGDTLVFPVSPPPPGGVSQGPERYIRR